MESPVLLVLFALVGLWASLGRCVASPAQTVGAAVRQSWYKLPQRGVDMVLRRRAQNTVLAVGLACVPSISGLARASSCNKDVVAPIEMTLGQVCWIYRGAATTFVGSFSSGQAITAQMIGQASEYDPRSGRVATVWRPRDLKVEAGRFLLRAAQAPGELTFVAPANGPYRFSFSPCAMGGRSGSGHDLRALRRSRCVTARTKLALDFVNRPAYNATTDES